MAFAEKRASKVSGTVNDARGTASPSAVVLAFPRGIAGALDWKRS